MANNDFKLPGKDSGQLIPELDESLMALLDEQLQRQEMQGIERISGEQERRGFFRSGNTQKRITEEVLGPSLERRSQALTGLAKESATMGREERMGEEQFQRQRQFAAENFQRQLELAQQGFEFQKMLMELEDELQGGGFMDVLGGLAGGIGGSFLGPAGAAAGAKLGQSLFG